MSRYLMMGIVLLCTLLIHTPLSVAQIDVVISKDQVLRGELEFRDVHIPKGVVAFVDSDLTLKARNVVVAGKLVCHSPKPEGMRVHAPNVSIIANSIEVSGSILGAPGLDGEIFKGFAPDQARFGGNGSTVILTGVRIGLDGKVIPGNGGAGGGLGGRGGDGGSVYLIAFQFEGSKESARRIVGGAGGQGGKGRPGQTGGHGGDGGHALFGKPGETLDDEVPTHWLGPDVEANESTEALEAPIEGDDGKSPHDSCQHGDSGHDGGHATGGPGGNGGPGGDAPPPLGHGGHGGKGGKGGNGTGGPGGNAAICSCESKSPGVDGKDGGRGGRGGDGQGGQGGIGGAGGKGSGVGYGGHGGSGGSGGSGRSGSGGKGANGVDGDSPGRGGRGGEAGSAVPGRGGEGGKGGSPKGHKGSNGGKGGFAEGTKGADGANGRHHRG